MHRRTSLRLILLGAAGLGLGACASTGGTTSGSDTVLAVARRHQLNRFLGAIDAAGLTAMLQSDGPYTVFTPTDRAFAGARLPRDPDALRSLMRYHIVPGTFTTEFLRGSDMNYTTSRGTSLNVDGTAAGLTVNGARVIAPDLMASNGVVHIIDRVLTPG